MRKFWNVHQNRCLSSLIMIKFMRFLIRNPILSYDGKVKTLRLILRDAIKPGVSKSGITKDILSYAHHDLYNGYHFLLYIWPLKGWKSTLWPTHCKCERFLRIDFCISLILGSILWVPNFIFLFSFPSTSILGHLNAFYVSILSRKIYWLFTNGPRTGWALHLLDLANKIHTQVSFF